MSDERLRCVVDTSVGIKMFVVEPLSDRADALFAHLTANPAAQFYVPDLFFVECANILWKYVRRYGYDAADALRDLGDLADLALRSVSTGDLMSRALELALAHDITAYDACYAALAECLDLPLITADQALVGKLTATTLRVRWLGDFPIPPLPPF